jgi:hypothetical protein
MALIICYNMPYAFYANSAKIIEEIRPQKGGFTADRGRR